MPTAQATHKEMIDKLIVTNLNVLGRKYGKGIREVEEAIQGLIDADAKRGLHTILVPLDDARALKPFNLAPVSQPLDPEQNKVCIDGLYTSLQPDYLLILGASDVVPHQDLVNPLHDPRAGLNGDPDPIVYSDLPYACGSPYGKKVGAFKNPSRVVGRLPDVTGATDPGYLIEVLKFASSYQAKPAKAYLNYLGVSAEIWSTSTAESLEAAFNDSAGMKVVPPMAPAAVATALEAPAHFINCHGAPASPQYYGQPASGAGVFPVAMDAAALEGRVRKGTVVAAECCYGAELYDPKAADKHLGIPNQYLLEGAYGFFGSTTVAYGPSNDNDWADLLCQYFFKSLISGASLGRAALEARQNYILHKGHLSANDLKTLAQFILLGDPAVTPVEAPAAAPQPHLLRAGASFMAADPTQAKGVERKARRKALLQNGLALANSVDIAESRSKSKPQPAIQDLLRKEAAKLNLEKPNYLTFDVKPAALRSGMQSLRSMASKGIALQGTPRELKAIHFTIGQSRQRDEHCMGLAGVEVHEYSDSVTIHPFESR